MTFFKGRDRWGHIEVANRRYRLADASPRERDKDHSIGDHANLSRASVAKGEDQGEQRED